MSSTKHPIVRATCALILAVVLSAGCGGSDEPPIETDVSVDGDAASFDASDTGFDTVEPDATDADPTDVADADASDAADVDPGDTNDGGSPDVTLPPACGDGVLDADEACDGDELGGATCATLGFASGALACTDACTRDVSGCSEDPGPLCGDDVVEGDEACDGDDLADTTCEGLGFDGGAVTCSDTCAIVTDGCTTDAVCGDGVVAGPEACDDGNDDAGDGCFACALEACGDGVVSGDEACEPGQVVPVDCGDDGVGFADCTDGCTLDAASCPSVETCGDGALDPWEGCDDGNTDDGDGCDSTCATEACDGALDAGEACDGVVPPATTCASFGFTTGTLACVDCRLVLDGCVTPVCGDGRIEGDERCDDGGTRAGDGCDARCQLEGCAAEDAIAVWFDDDEDGVGGASAGYVCALEEGLVDIGGDCNDDDDAISPDAAEQCDGVDNDCDGDVDEDATDAGDACDTGLEGVCADGVRTCIDGDVVCVGSVARADETCNGLDDDCDGDVDEARDGEPLSRACYTGAEGTEGVGLCVGGTEVCDEGVWSACLDEIVPADETCDGADENCDGDIDEGLPVTTRYVDEDGDGFGVEGLSIEDCRLPEGYADRAGDCDDTRATDAPGADEVLDGRDNDCDGDIDDGTTAFDDDGDGFCEVAPCVGGLPGGDCDDGADDRYPGAPERVDGIDQDCDDVADNGTPSWDDDGDGYCEVGPCVTGALGDGDCDDTLDTVYPGAPDLLDGLDNNCNGAIDDAKQWLGGDPAGPTSWHIASNWDPAGVPTVDDGLFVGADRPNQPTLTAAGIAGAIHVEDGATVSLDGFVLTIAGDVRAGATIVGPGTLEVTGADAMIEGTVPNTTVTGTALLSDDLVVDGTLTLGGASTLRPNGHTITVRGDLVTSVGRTTDGLTMTDPADRVVVEGDVAWGSVGSAGSNRGALTDGTIEVWGDFTQTQGRGADAEVFVSTGTTVVFAGVDAQTVTLATGRVGGSVFNDVEIANPVGVQIGANVVLTGDLTFADDGVAIGPDLYFAGPLPVTDPGNLVDRLHVVTDRTLSAVAPYTVSELVVDTGVEVTLGEDGFTVDGAFDVDGTLTLAGATFTVDGDATFNGRVTVGAGEVIVTGATIVRGSNALVDVATGSFTAQGTAEVTADNVQPQGIRITDAAGTITFEDDVVFTTEEHGRPNPEANLRVGTVRFGGDLTQQTRRFGGGVPFVVDGATTAFVGAEPQVITFAAPGFTAVRMSNVVFDNPTEVRFASSGHLTGETEHRRGLVIAADLFFADALPTVAESGWNVTETHVAASFETPVERFTSPALVVDPGAVLTFGGASFTAEGPFTINGGTVETGGIPFAVEGTALITNAGQLTLGGGTATFDDLTLNDEGDLVPEGGTVEVLGALTMRQQGAVPHGVHLSDADDLVIVHGLASFPEANFTTADTAAILTGGVFEFRGGLTQSGATGSHGKSFRPRGTLVRFDGEGSQAVSFGRAGETVSSLDDVEFVSGTTGFVRPAWIVGTATIFEGAAINGADLYFTSALPFGDGLAGVSRVHPTGDFVLDDRDAFTTPMIVVDAGSTLTFGRDMDLTAGLTVAGDVNLDGHRVDVDGIVALTSNTATLDVGGGALSITDDVSMSTNGAALVPNGGLIRIGGTFFAFVGPGYRGLVMTNDDDEVIIEGNATFRSNNSSTDTSAGSFTAGTLRLRANLVQINGIASANRAIVAAGTLFVFDGDEPQSIILDRSNASASSLRDVVIDNPAGVTVSRTLLITGSVEVIGRWRIATATTVEGTLTLRETSTLDVDATLTTAACVAEPAAVIEGAYTCE